MRAALAIVLLAAPAAAEHDHGGGTPPGSGTALDLAVDGIAASYRSRLFGGEYEGIGDTARGTLGPYGAFASATEYRLVFNGKTVHGPGDAVVGGQLAILRDDKVHAGIALAVGLPTGDEMVGLGMGHTMIMPSGWSSWSRGRLLVSGSLGFHQGFGGSAAIHAEHGGGAGWPIVEPMNYQELTGGIAASYAVWQPLRAGVGVSAGVPTSDGVSRAIGVVRTTLVTGRFETALELQIGLAGDPFRVRGLIETALRL
jgi:hypothetical protein